MKIGVFVPIGNNGWLISTHAPQYMPTFELNKAIVQKAEHYHFDFAPLAAIKEYIRLKLEVSRDYPQASRLFCMEMLAGAPLLMDELTGDLKALIDEKSALIAGWVKSGKLAPIDPQHLIFMIWASTQHYADFAPQVEAVTGATLRDEVFFNQTVENVQRIIIEGIRPR